MKFGPIFIMLILALSLAGPVLAYTMNSNLGSQVDVPYNQNTTRRVTISNNDGGPIYMIVTKSGFTHSGLIKFAGIYDSKVVEIPDSMTKNCDITFLPFSQDITKKENGSIVFKKATLTQTNFLCTGDGARTEFIFSSLPVLDGGATVSFDAGNTGTYQYSFNYDVPKVVFTPALAVGDKATVTYKYASATSDEQTINFTLSYTGKYSNVYTRKFTKDKKVEANPYTFKLVTVGSYTQVEINDNSLSPQMYANSDAESFYVVVVPDQIAMACTGIAGNDAYFTIFSAFPITWGSTTPEEEDPMEGDVSDMLDWWTNKVSGGASDKWWSVEKWWGNTSPPSSLSNYMETNLVYKTLLTTSYYTKTEVDSKIGMSGGTGGAPINDNITSTTSTWSSSKIATQLQAVGGSGGDYSNFVTNEQLNARLASYGGGNGSSVDAVFVKDTNMKIADLYSKVGGSSFFGTGISNDIAIVVAFFGSVMLSFIFGRSSTSKGLSPEFGRQRAMKEQDRERVGYSDPTKPGIRFPSLGKRPSPQMPQFGTRPQPSPTMKPKVQEIDLTERPDIEKKIHRLVNEMIEEELKNGKARAGE